jgi:CPA2 family monovalent cation:H+ antiporter-2
VRHQASANALPLKDTFAVIFFLSVGMLFNPMAIVSNFALFLGIMVIILVIKPLIAYIIVVVMRQSYQTALLVAIALAQIGEFSFILSEEALKLKILPDDGFDIIVACALISIAANPLLFKASISIGRRWDKEKQEKDNKGIDQQISLTQQAIIVGFGPVGQDVARILEQFKVIPVIIDTNVDTIALLRTASCEAVFGDATSHHILEAAHVEAASILIITTPDIKTTMHIIETARLLNPDIKIIARALFITDQKQLAATNVSTVCDENESKHAFRHMIETYLESTS